MFDSTLWLTAWNWEPTVLVGLSLFCALYLFGVGPLRRSLWPLEKIERRQIILFFAGVFVIFLALVSPLDEIGDHYLFSAHMVQHLLLILALPPLLLIGTPGWLLKPLLQKPLIARLGRFLTLPLPALLVFNFVFAVYHVPALYDWTLRDETVHIIVHLLLMATAVITWSPILSPLREWRLALSFQVLYLFLQAIPPTILGALITFSPEAIYPTYVAAPRVFDISALEDQQMAGVIMWIPGALVYLLALTIVFFKWFGDADSRDQEQVIGGKHTWQV